MLKITVQDLQRKSNRQLTALFNQAASDLKRASRLSQAFNLAQAAMTLIRQELVRRGPSP